MKEQDLGKRIMKLRKEKGMTQKELADKLNVTIKTISKWENGNIIPSIYEIKQIAQVFEVDLSALIEENNEKKMDTVDNIIDNVFLGISLATGICVVIVALLQKLNYDGAMMLLGISISCLALYLLKNRKNK